MLVTYEQYHTENRARWQKVNSSGAWETPSSDLRHFVIKKVPDQHARNVYIELGACSIRGRVTMKSFFLTRLKKYPKCVNSFINSKFLSRV